MAAWHPAHSTARQAAKGARISAHARIETYSVLTRLPPPHRFGAGLAAEALRLSFPPGRTLAPSPELVSGLVERCAERGIAGGAVYDALVALTAAEAGATLLSRDRRAASTYERLGVEFELLA